MMVFPSAAVYSVTTPISEDTKLTVGDLVSGTGAMFLFYGWGCIVWQAMHSNVASVLHICSQWLVPL